jgi:hypothetical protein
MIGTRRRFGVVAGVTGAEMELWVIGAIWCCWENAQYVTFSFYTFYSYIVPF